VNQEALITLLIFLLANICGWVWTVAIMSAKLQEHERRIVAVEDLAERTRTTVIQLATKEGIHL
jgi:hypothetical protein